MTAGARSTYVTFEVRETTQDPNYGSTVEGDWVMHSQAWAEVQDVLPSRSESVDDTITLNRRPARIRIDEYDGIGLTSSMRIKIDADEVWPERVLRIISGPAFVENSREWELIGEQLSTSGEDA